MKGLKGFQKGKNNPGVINGAWNKGKKTPKEVIKKLSESHKGYIMPEEQKKKISRALKGKSKPKGFIQKVSGKNHHNWKGGKSFKSYSVDWTETLRKSIRQRDKYTCQVCNKEPSIQVHHIDYNKKNNNPDNLITLCRSCHMKTNFNREYWIEYFKNI